jgi:hypothetical protein
MQRPFFKNQPKTNNIDTMRNKKMYDIPIRKCIYYCLLNNVSVETAATVIEMVVKEMTGDCVQSLPSVATISRMAYEMGVLSDIQSGELLVTQDNITLAWDATCIDGSHINEVHICAPGGKANVLQINELPGGKTDDYYTHIANSINDAVMAYSACFNLDVVSKISS